MGARPAPPDPATHEVERSLRREAARLAPLADTVRLAAALLAASDGRPSLRTVLQHDDGALELLVDPPALPVAPFTGDPGRWRLSGQEADFTAAAADRADPAPTLALLGRHGDAACYRNLEADGLIAVTGEPSDAHRLLLALVDGLAGAPWASLVRVLAPASLAGALAALDRVDVADDLPARLGELAGDAAAVAAELRAAGHTTLPAARSGDADTVAMTVVVGAGAEHLTEELITLARDPLAPLVMIVTGAHPAAVPWQLAEGTLRLPDVDAPVQAMLADRDRLHAAAELLETTVQAPAVPAEHPHYQRVREGAPADPATGTVEVAVLGPTELRGVARPNRRSILDITVYLALHRSGVDGEQLSTALWPEDLVSSQTYRNRVSETRLHLGRGSISHGPRWRLDEKISCDWQRFQALAAGDLADRHAALALVRGQPFTGLGSPEWLHLEGFVSEAQATITDLAVAVAVEELEAGRPAAAYTAARAGLRGCPYDERLYRLAILATHRQADTAKVRALITEMKAVLDIEIQPDDDLEAETLALCDQLTADARQRRAS